MSHIFDALQRSEGEDSGIDSPGPQEATDLLRRAERKAASRWETTALAEPCGATEDPEPVTSLGPAEVQPDAAVADDGPSGKPLQDRADADAFGQFQALQVSVGAQDRLVCFTDAESLAAEAFRLLGVRLRNLRQKRPLKRVLVTSTIPQEGKSMIAANLACTLTASTKQKVLLLDGDLRRPSLSQKFAIGSISGLSEWLQDEHSQIPAIYRLEGPGLWLLPAGRASSNALELLQSSRLPALMDQLSVWFDWIIIDSPPVLPLADASVWMRYTDGILLVARQGTTEKRQLQKGLEAIEQKKLIGALLNCSKNAAHSGYYYYYNHKPRV
jgi:capsular exopolysaccharide synthesis family protein